MNNFHDVLLMKHELLLLISALVILIADIFRPDGKKQGIINFSLILFFVVTVVSFIPTGTGVLFGGSFESSRLTDVMKDILNIAVLIIFLQSESYLRQKLNAEKIAEYFAVLLMLMVGMDYMISSGDFLTFFIGLETASIPLAGMAAYDKYKSRSAEAGVKLILLSALSSGVLLFGISMIYGATGSIYFKDIALKVTDSPLMILGFIFFVSGIGFKLSLVPFHLWAADVYEGAPVTITAFLSVVSKGAAAFIFAIILFTVFKNIVHIWETALYALAVLTMTIGNLFALRQDNIKRFLAFSSIAQAGYIILGIMGTGALGMTTLVYYILVYVFTNLAAFGVAAAISNASGVEEISGYKSLYSTNPKLSLLMMLSMFSLAGIPPVAGFFGKFFLFTSAGSRGYFILILIAVINATISLYYYLRVVKAMFIDKTDTPVATFKSSLSMRIGLVICALGIFAVGFLSGIFEYLMSLSSVVF